VNQQRQALRSPDALDPDDRSELAVFDYTIDENLTDYVIAVRFNPQGHVVSVDMES
jgi:hypothetical protein